MDYIEWKDLGIEEQIVDQIQSYGLKRPTKIQINTIPTVLNGGNIIGSAKTGSGKTAAYALPVLQLLSKDPYGVFALVLSPTRFEKFII